MDFYNKAIIKVNRELSETVQSNPDEPLDLIKKFKGWNIKDVVTFLSDGDNLWGDVDEPEHLVFYNAFEDGVVEFERGIESLDETNDLSKDVHDVVYTAVLQMGRILRRVDKFLAELEKSGRIHGMQIDNPITVYEILTNAQIFNAKKNNDRIRQQQGAFILPAFPIENKTKEEEDREIDRNTQIQYSLEKLMIQSIKYGQEEKHYVDSINSEALKNNRLPSFSPVVSRIQLYDILQGAPHPIAIKITGLENIKSIETQLESLSIHAGTMYPDIKNQSDYLVKKLRRSYQDNAAKSTNQAASSEGA